MAVGGHMTAMESHKLRRVPVEKPSFTVGQIKKAIPPHCFERSVLCSSSYLISDLIIVSALLYLALYQIPKLPSPYNYLAWPLYWICQGCISTGVWVIAHECGHHAFSDYQLLDDTVGLLLHSCLLVPYFSFKHSHRRHHSNAGSLDGDEVFVPRTRYALHWFTRDVSNPFDRLRHIFMVLALGWPMYLTFNAWGRPYPRFASHFDPYSPIYSSRERAQVVISDVAIIAVVCGLCRLAMAFSLEWVIRIYGVPLLIVNGFLVLITFLQHTHTRLPRYDSSEWDWLRGQLATIDRDYGILSKIFHNVTDTHVAHHLFSTMPHYNAMEATKAIKPVLGEYYQFDSTPVYKALWREAKECLYVEPGEDKSKGVYWFSDKL